MSTVEGETSSFECAHQLGKLCENRHLVVNLIPYNSTDVKDKLRCPSDAHMQEFRRIVSSYGSFCTIRRTMGADIASACGQLVQTKSQEEAMDAIDIEDVVGRSGDTAVNGVSARSSSVLLKPTKKLSSSTSWIKSLPNEDLDLLDSILTIAAGLSASCFILSTLIYAKKR
eukprot:scaffold2271_cov130-Cylindrotheca_fusiformis.AAC.19